MRGRVIETLTLCTYLVSVSDEGRVRVGRAACTEYHDAARGDEFVRDHETTIQLTKQREFHWVGVLTQERGSIIFQEGKTLVNKNK